MFNLRLDDHREHLTRMCGRYRNGVFANQKHTKQTVAEVVADFTSTDCRAYFRHHSSSSLIRTSFVFVPPTQATLEETKCFETQFFLPHLLLI